LEYLYGQIADTSFLGSKGVVLLLGLLVLLLALFQQSEAFERFVRVRIRGPLTLAYGTFGLPLILVLMEVQRRRGGGGILRILGGLVLVVILLIIGFLALVAFLIYWFLRRRR
jgi:hypothetical protein